MDKTEIQKKAGELQNILLKYRGQLSLLEKQLSNAISEYQKAIDEQKVKELRESLIKHE